VGTDTRRPAQRKKQRAERVLLIALSPAREKLLLDEPELVPALVRERSKTTIPRSVEFDERFHELQRALSDFASKVNARDEHADALTPRSGTLVYEDETVEAARLLGAEQALVVARWLLGLPRDLIARSPIEGELARLRTFYSELAGLGHALLSIRFRE
jgi:hypothetical protein